MKIEVRSANEAIISGYVNAVERESRVLPARMCAGAPGDFVERVKAKAFERALSRNSNVELRFNHREWLGDESNGALELREDAIGLFAVAKVTDPNIVRKAQNGELRGWSFAFKKIKDGWDKDGDLNRRNLEDFDLREVSILDKTPAYIGTSIEMRGEEEDVIEERGTEDEAEEIKEPEPEKPETKSIPCEVCRKRIELTRMTRMRGKTNA